jgi:ATP-binding cassette subfamily B protein
MSGARPVPAWHVLLRVFRFRLALWLADQGSALTVLLLYQVTALATRSFFDLLAGDAPVRLGIWAIIALFVGAELGRNIGYYGFVVIDPRFFADVATLVRKNMLRRIYARPAAMALTESPGEAISRFRDDVDEIANDFPLTTNDMISQVVMAAVALTVMASINIWITLLAMAPLVLIGVVGNLASRRLERYRRASREATGAITGFIGELFGAAQAVQVATAEVSVIAHFDGLNDRRRQAALRERLFDAVLHSAFHSGATVGTGVVLILAAQSLRAGTFTIGDLALFTFYLEFLTELTTLAGSFIARYRQVGVSIERMHHLTAGGPADALTEYSPVYMDGKFPPIVYPPKTPADRLDTLEAAGLTYHYPGTDKGIAGIDLRLERGTLTVVTGRVGSGKTTLLRVLLGLLPREAGEIRWNGQAVADPGAFFTPPRCAYTAQVPRLFSDTLRDNILLGLGADDEALARAVRLAVLEEDIGQLEKGLETMVGPRGVRLSGGQVQRAAAARMFARQPELLVFDDLSSALDVETERVLWERVFAEPGLTCLVVSHRRAVLRHAGRVIVLKEGRVEAQGRLDDLLQDCPEMQQLWQGDTVPS